MDLKKLLYLIQDVVQFEWGDFFLFKEFPKRWINPNGIKYPKLIIQTDTTIRAVDNGYIYVYTPCQDVIEIIKKNYEIESIKTDDLANLDYPF